MSETGVALLRGSASPAELALPQNQRPEHRTPSGARSRGRPPVPRERPGGPPEVSAQRVGSPSAASGWRGSPATGRSHPARRPWRAYPARSAVPPASARGVAGAAARSAQERLGSPAPEPPRRAWNRRASTAAVELVAESPAWTRAVRTRMTAWPRQPAFPTWELATASARHPPSPTPPAPGSAALRRPRNPRRSPPRRQWP